jgi:single-strand DNA-binding protein
MASSVNKVILVGRLGKDPEVRFTQGGKAVANFSIATDESFKDASGEKQKKTEWHNIVVWGNSVEAFVQKYLHKGDMVYIEGKLQTRSWEKDGVKKYTTEVNVTDIKGLVLGDSESQPAAQQQQRPAATQSRSAVVRRDTAPMAAQVDDEDMPF